MVDACQADLFAADEQQLPLGGAYRLNRGFIDEPEALMAELQSALTFEERSIVLFGREVLQPRLIAWGGDWPYTYSGDTLEPRRLPAAARRVLTLVNEELARLAPEAPQFNHLLANLYRDGSDSMGLHSDDERELGPAPWVGSVSLGAARCFQIAPKKKYRVRGETTEKWSVSLTSGSLLFMEPPMQKFYVHGLPKTKREVGARLNLTFRSIVTQGRSEAPKIA